uniref:NADH-ubiquinone oxidoreductase chain 6 n=1 Tax=Alpheus digitalis TaxID=674293 RepID=E7BLM1_ALPDI|nr:NADH dehydrogenase subunit 6 [Alpheus distinguendus]ACV90186.1 NADH dehydrogenase subunit 6 [Alpheus distinguendus]
MPLFIISSFLLLSTSYLFTRLRHPLAMGLTLIFQTTLICLSSGASSSFTWMSYILFLIFLGATLVLFIYVASLASNEVFNLSYPMALLVASPLIITIPLLAKDELIQPLKPNMQGSSLILSETILEPTFKLAMMYNPSTAFLTSFVVLYLLLTLVVIVKLSSSSSGPLRLS